MSHKGQTSMATATATRFDPFTEGYIECALWSSSNLDGRPLDELYGPADIAPDTIASMIEDCQDFQTANWELICHDLSQAGHDFWLTRNRHGAGFWDGDWPNKAGRILTDAAHAYGSVDLTDDGKWVY